MPHGTPDWADLVRKETIYGGIDLAEHAARVDSIVTFDRRGDIVWLDNFEEGIYHWDIGWVGLANICRIDYNTSRNGICSAVMQPTAGDTDNRAYLEHFNPFNREGRLGLEASFSLAGDSAVIQIRFRVYSTIRSLEVGIRYDPVNDTLEYLNDTLGWTAFAEKPGLHRVFRLFHTCKIVVNTTKPLYERILLDDHLYDMKKIPTNDPGAAATSYVRMQLIAEALVAPVNYVYWDDVILTQNEP